MLSALSPIFSKALALLALYSSMTLAASSNLTPWRASDSASLSVLTPVRSSAAWNDGCASAYACISDAAALVACASSCSASAALCATVARISSAVMPPSTASAYFFAAASAESVPLSTSSTARARIDWRVEYSAESSSAARWLSAFSSSASLVARTDSSRSSWAWDVQTCTSPSMPHESMLACFSASRFS